ncbi:MAG: DUF3572 family protein [Rhizobiaceae bacterium]|nr:DUF3572 family protein [Rhizobiaceae bacterium]
MNSINHQSAEAIAIAGLSRLAGDDDLLMRFCGITGILPNDIRQASGQPGFLVGVLDFYLAHEPDLLAWAEADDLRPESIVAARHSLSPNDQSGFE